MARAWLQLLPLGMVFTAERAAYVTLANHAATFFAQGQDPKFDLSLCSDNEYNHWIGAQIRADVYGWVLPGNPAEAARGSIAGRDDAVEALHARFGHLSPVHTINNLALVVWALLTNPDDLGAAVGDAVAAGWDTDCNGATVGGLWGITGQPVPEEWTAPWASRVAVSLAGHDELPLESLIDRTVAVGERLADR